MKTVCLHVSCKVPKAPDAVIVLRNSDEFALDYRLLKSLSRLGDRRKWMGKSE